MRRESERVRERESMREREKERKKMCLSHETLFADYFRLN